MDRCPFCGAEYLSGPGRANLPMFACGTIPKTLMRDYDCYEREIAALKSDLALWKDFWDNMRHADKVIYENICTHTKRLKERGLI